MMPSRGRRHQEGDDEADDDGADDDVAGFGADAGQNDQRDPLVEPGGGHCGGKKQRGCHQRQRCVGEAAERQAEAGAGAHQHLWIGGIGGQAEQERHQCGNDHCGDRVVERFGHPDDDGERQHSQHALPSYRKPFRRR
jgi:hypothetical protein